MAPRLHDPPLSEKNTRSKTIDPATQRTAPGDAISALRPVATDGIAIAAGGCLDVLDKLEETSSNLFQHGAIDLQRPHGNDHAVAYFY